MRKMKNKKYSMRAKLEKINSQYLFNFYCGDDLIGTLVVDSIDFQCSDRSFGYSASGYTSEELSKKGGEK
jgi:hypothetical protein